MREVEAQPVRRHQRPLLAYVLAQHGAQGGMQQVGGGVVPPDGLAASPVNGGERVLSGHDLAGDPRLVRDQPAGRRPCRRSRPAGLGHDGARVAYLPSASA